jgi:hypothetical protein
MTNTVAIRIMRAVRARGRGWVFTPADFDRADRFGGRAAIDQALSRLARRGFIRRLARGVYDYPRVNPRFGTISPTPDAVAHAIARKTRSKLQIDGAQAANALGLSTQVPAHVVYLTDGPSRKVAIGRRVVTLRHASPRHLVAAGSPAGTVVQALRYLGHDVGPDILDRVANQLSASDRQVLLRTATQLPRWIRPALNRIANTLPAAA